MTPLTTNAFGCIEGREGHTSVGNSGNVEHELEMQGELVGRLYMVRAVNDLTTIFRHELTLIICHVSNQVQHPRKVTCIPRECED
jgi:hypothetical protein